MGGDRWSGVDSGWVDFMTRRKPQGFSPFRGDEYEDEGIPEEGETSTTGQSAPSMEEIEDTGDAEDAGNEEDYFLDDDIDPTLVSPLVSARLCQNDDTDCHSVVGDPLSPHLASD